MTYLSKVHKRNSLLHKPGMKVVELAPVVVAAPSNMDDADSPVSSLVFQETKQRAEQTLADAQEMAEKLIMKAKSHAEETKQQAEHDIQAWWKQKEQEWQQAAQQAKSDGFEQGVRDGEKEGLKEAEREYRDLIAEAKDVLEQAYHDREEIVSEAEPFLVELSVEIAKKVIQQELSMNPDALLELIRQMLQRSKESISVDICVHPSDYDFVKKQKHQLMETTGGQVELNIFPDHSIADGGCILRTSFGSMDARVDSQLEEIQETLLQIAARDEADET
jgi:flagellar assembly protein FliH